MVALIWDALAGPIGWAVGAVVALAAAFFAGSRKARQKAAAKADKAYRETRERIDHADDGIVDDVPSAVERLRKRGQQ
jgi:uncharacterized membrane protein YccC